MKNLAISYLYVTCLLAVIFTSCTPKPKPVEDSIATVASVSERPFGTTPDGEAVTLYTLTNKNGVEMSVMNIGGAIVTLKVPDKNGKLEDVVLGFDSLSSYIKDSPYFGALVGRVGNRIAKGQFTLDGKKYALAVNNGKNHLHGGVKGFGKVFWNIEVLSTAENPSLKLSYLSKDMEEGYPGNLKVEVIYTLTEDNAVKIDYTASTDKRTVLNLTQHTYFNLTGDAKRDVLEHQIMLAADQFVPVDDGLIPLGPLKPVANTPFDFTKLTTVGARINDVKDEQVKLGGGYDHCWVFTDKSGGLRKVGEVFEPTSGRRMELSTTEPGVQFYTGNFLTGKTPGKGGAQYPYRYGFCLETEHYPDSPNHADYPSVVLDPGKTFHSTTVFSFPAPK